MLRPSVPERRWSQGMRARVSPPRVMGRAFRSNLRFVDEYRTAALSDRNRDRKQGQVQQRGLDPAVEATSRQLGDGRRTPHPRQAVSTWVAGR